MHSAGRLIFLTVAAAAVTACGTRTIETREVVREQPIIQQAPAPQPAQHVVVERVVPAPAAPQETIPPAPGPGYSWIAGHHEWSNGRWTWRPGEWRAGTIRPMPAPMDESPTTPPPSASARWVPGHWSFVGSDWVWVRGQWQ
jgi:hypothetical protein